MTARSAEGAAGWLIAAAALAASADDAAAAGDAADEASIRLTISGLAPGAAYAGTCRLAGAADVAIEGTQATSYEFDASSLRCEIDATAPLTITIEKAGNRPRSRSVAVAMR